MNADGIARVIRAWGERMIGQHALQPGDGVAQIATSKPRRNFRVAEKRVGALGLRRMQSVKRCLASAMPATVHGTLDTLGRGVKRNLTILTGQTANRR